MLVSNTAMLVTLMGVVMGWLWSCHKKKGKSKQRDENAGEFNNPTYSPTHIPSTRYSSAGPRGTPPTSHTPRREVEEEEEAIYQDIEQEDMYHVLEKEGEGQERDYRLLGGEGEEQERDHRLLRGEGQERDYREVDAWKQEEGEVYEIPIQTKSTGKDDSSVAVEMMYSTLYHK